MGGVLFARELRPGRGFAPRRFIGESATLDGAVASAGEASGIAHDGVGAQHVQAGLVGRELFIQVLLQGLVAADAGTRFVQCRLRRIDVAARIVEIGLRLAQGACATSSGDLRIAPIAGAEGSDRFAHGLDFRQIATQIGEFAHGFGHILEGRTIERTQRMGQGIGKTPLIRILGQLRLTQLDQGVDQRVVALGPEPKQLLVHGSTVGLGARKHLAMRADGLDQALARQRGFLRGREP